MSSNYITKGSIFWWSLLIFPPRKKGSWFSFHFFVRLTMAAAEVIDQGELLTAFGTTSKSKFSLPKELYEKNAAEGLRVLVKTFSLVTLGVLFTIFMPSFLSPVGMLLTGCGMSMLYLVGAQCKKYVYFDSKIGNSIARELTHLFLMEGWISCTFFVVAMACLFYNFGVCFLFFCFLFLFFFFFFFSCLLFFFFFSFFFFFFFFFLQFFSFLSSHLLPSG